MADCLGTVAVQSRGIDDRPVELVARLVTALVGCPVVLGDVQGTGAMAAFTTDSQFLDLHSVVAVVDRGGSSGMAKQTRCGDFSLESQVMW